MIKLTRRGMLGAMGAAGALAHAAPLRAADPRLVVSSRQIEVNGRAATVWGITGPDGRQGLHANAGDRFDGLVSNRTDGDLVLHWHGQTLAPWDQDRARPGGGALAAGAEDRHGFDLTPGTHWMHAHQLSEQLLLAAPMVTREVDAAEDVDHVVMLHDFSFRSPEEILAGLGGTAAHGAGSSTGMMAHGAHGGNAMENMGGMSGMGGMVHANDVDYDAFLANDRTLADPEVLAADPGASVRLRIINGATATAFWIRTGDLGATCVAVDGLACRPVTARAFPIAQGQRLDLVVVMPDSGGAFPVLAQVEASRRRTGVILASPGATVARVADEAADEAPHLDLSLDFALSVPEPAGAPAPSAGHHLTLGEEPGYRWTINGAVHGEHAPMTARLGERAEIMFMNPTSMMHPMHLHGHHFRVVGIGMDRVQGPLRDTVIVPPMQMVTVAVDPAKAGSWFLHCHHLYHMATGMMTELTVT